MPVPDAPAEWNYLDVMKAILDSLPETRLRAENADWHTAWKHVIDTADGDHLLKDVTFEDRGPFPPYSEEVQVSRHVFQRAGILSLGNPRYQYFTVERDPSEVVEAIQRHHAEAIKALAAALWDSLGVSSKTRNQSAAATP
jgi:hypothetical protein